MGSGETDTVCVCVFNLHEPHHPSAPLPSANYVCAASRDRGQTEFSLRVEISIYRQPILKTPLCIHSSTFACNSCVFYDPCFGAQFVKYMCPRRRRGASRETELQSDIETQLWKNDGTFGMERRQMTNMYRHFIADPVSLT